MKMKFIHIALISTILLLCSYGAAFGATGNNKIKYTCAEFQEAVDAATGAWATLGTTDSVIEITNTGTITLNKNVYLNCPLAINQGLTVTIKTKSGGGTRQITYNGAGETTADGTNSLIRVRTGATLKIIGNNHDERIYISGGAKWTAEPPSDTMLNENSLTPVSGCRELAHGIIYSIGTLELTLVNLRDVYNPYDNGFGGAITIANNDGCGKTTLSGTYIYRCVGYTGAAMYLRGSDTVTDADATKVTLKEIQTTAKNADTGVTESVTKETLIYFCKTTTGSGMIRTNGNTDCSLLMQNTIIRYCYSSEYAGAMHWNAAGTPKTICTMKGCHFHRNIGHGKGGALFMESSFKFEEAAQTTRIGHNEVRGNNSYGGGMCVNAYNGGAYDTATNYVYTFDSNVVFQENSSTTNGGGLAFTFGAGSIPEGSTVNIKFTGAQFTKNTASSDGGGIYIWRASNATQYTMKTQLNSGTVQNNTANIGGGVYINNIDVEAEDSNDVFTVNNNTSTSQGGGMYIYTSDVTFNNIKITNNTSTTAFGGGVYARMCKVNINNATITGNKAKTEGGGIQINNDGAKNNVTNITKGTFSNNVSTTNGGGLYAKYGTVNIGTATFSGNTAANGGGVYSNESTINITSTAKFQNNNATTTAEITDGSGGGGGIFVFKGNLNMSGAATFTGNTSTECGGGFYVDNGNLNITSSTAANISSNTSSLAGAGFFVRLGNVDIENATISNNTASTHGGGFYILGNDDGTKGIVTIETVTLEGNKANYVNNTGNGGAIYLSKGGLNITKSAIINNNKANGYGGGIYATGGNVIITDAELESNTATTSGGGIYATNGDVTITNATLTGNSANNGGGIYTLGNGTLGNVTITNATFNQNKATSGSGGGLFVNTGDLKILTLASFNSNTATTSGGAMYATGGHITIANAEMQSNTATASGGGIYATGGDVAITNATLTGNSSATGGGIFVNDGNISISSNAIIKSNKATSTAGGGLCATDGDISIANADISSNSAVTSGGGIHLEGGTLTITKGTISSNTAGTYGGGLHAESNTAKNITLAGGGVFTNNVATTCGGGISVSGPITLNTSGSIQSNSAKNGGGIYLTGGATMNFYEGMICNNQATGTSGTGFTTAYNKTASQVYGVGGGVFIEENSKLFFDIGSTTLGLYGNTATMAADDIFANGNGTAVEIPQVETMVLSGFDVPTSRLLWAEDYMAGDTGYANGTKIINNWDELDDKFSYVTRYKVAQSVLALRELAFSASSLTLPREDSEAYPPGPGRYVCLTLGYNNMSIKITKEGLKEGECAIFTYTRSGDVEPMGRIVLTGMGESVPVSKMIVLSEGTWIIAETGWGYTYNVSPISITRTISASSSDQDKTFTFTNTKRSSVPAHSEMNVLNIMK